MKRRTKVIAHSKKVRPQELRILKSRFEPRDIFFTSCFEDAALFAANAAQEGYEQVLVIGGDGLLSKAVSGYLKRQEKPDAISFGLIPSGSGNDFARSFGIPFQFGKAPDHFDNARPSPIDICRITYTGLNDEKLEGYFVNAADLGCMSHVVADFNRLKHLRHSIMYSVLGLIGSYRYNSQRIRIASGERQLFDGLIRWTSITNGKYVGGGLKFGKYPFADDGLFQIKIAHSLPKWKTILLGLRFVTLGIETHPNMLDYFVDHAQISSPEGTPILLEADGEILGKLPAEITLLPHHLQFHGRA